MSIRLCWNAIVKNESGRILRAAASVAPYISCYVIADTGSTDNTVQLLKDFFDRAGIPGHFVSCPFENFSQARNVALFAAQHAADLEFDFMLLMDADMELKVLDPIHWLDNIGDAPSYDMMQVTGALHYANRRLVKRSPTLKGYVGVTHEFLNEDTGGCISPALAFFQDYADGANRPSKLQRDVDLLRAGLEKEPKNERYMYYLAQSYRDMGKFDKAIKWYQRRIDAGGWDQEVWSAQYSMAHCYNALKQEGKFIRNMLIAYNMRPTRAESLYDLANWYRMKGENPVACMLAETGMQIPRSQDQLFVNDYVYSVGCKQEFSITAFYMPHPNKRAMGYKITNQLMLQKGPYEDARILARGNMFHYHAALKEFCPSYKTQRIDFEAPEHYIAMNPSIAWWKDKLYGVIRTVNYKIDDYGRYLIRATDGTCNGSNPIHTRNFLVSLETDTFKVISSKEIVGEPYLDAGLSAVKFDLVRGYEDMRLYTSGDKLWISSTVRELEADGPCEQVRVCLKPRRDHMYTTDQVRMRRRGHEKNWTPIADGSHRFLYRCDEIVDGAGLTIQKKEAPVVVDTLGGSSQAIKVAKGWIAIVHEANQIPNAPTRFYMHRFVAYDDELNFLKVTPPFYLDEKGIEYVAGMVVDLPNNRLIISYGFKDREARIATVSLDDVTRLILVS